MSDNGRTGGPKKWESPPGFRISAETAYIGAMLNCRSHRRAFLADLGLGFTGLAMGAMLQREACGGTPDAWSPPDGRPHFRPRAKSVIWLFMNGGVSHLESFDPKPALNQHAG